MGANSELLPEGFEPLQPFVSAWAGLDEMGRVNKRLSSSIEELKSFYDAAAPLFPKTMAYLQRCPIGSLTPSQDALFKLALGLVEISFTFEVFHGVFPPDLYDIRKISREIQLEVAE
jgi:hypothetical protein